MVVRLCFLMGRSQSGRSRSCAPFPRQILRTASQVSSCVLVCHRVPSRVVICRRASSFVFNFLPTSLILCWWVVSVAYIYICKTPVPCVSVSSCVVVCLFFSTSLSDFRLVVSAYIQHQYRVIVSRRASSLPFSSLFNLLISP